MKAPDTNSIGLMVSAVGHAALLAWGLFSFAPSPLEASPQESVPVDIVTSAEFSKMTKGAERAKVAEKPKPLVDKVAEEEKAAPELTEKIAKKTEVKTAAAPPEPPPVPKAKPEPKPEPEQAKPEPQPEKKPAPPEVDEIAEALKKEQARERARKQAAAAKAKAQAQAEQRRKQEQHKFDASQVAALLDKRNPQRLASTGREINTEPSLGRPDALAMRMSANELDAMRQRLADLWSPPAGVENPDDIVVVVRIQLSRDGRLAGSPQVVSRGQGPLYSAARESAVRAIHRGQPYDMLSPANYEMWRDVEITFDPRDMLRG